MTVTIVDAARPVTGGVDTHLDLNVAAALDGIGGLLAGGGVPPTAGRDPELLGWVSRVRAGGPGGGGGPRAFWAGPGPVPAGGGGAGGGGGPPQPAGPPPVRQVRSAGCGGGGPGGIVWPGLRGGQVPGRERGGDPGAGGGQAVRPVGQDPGPEPD